MAARQYGHEAWDRAVELAEAATPDPALDLETRGRWTAEKLHFLCQYLEQACRGIAGNPKFPGGLCYVDLFCGSGISSCLMNGASKRLPGSAMIAASLAPKGFSKLVLAEESDAKLAKAAARVKAIGFAGQIATLQGDVNTVIGDVVKAIPDRSLNIAFVDPYSLDIHYDTIERLARGRTMDLVILFSDRIDLQRNVRDVYYPRRSDKLDLFLGAQSDWRKRYEMANFPNGDPLLRLFGEIYCEQLLLLGYKHSETFSISGVQGPMFTIVFASKHELGKKYFEIVRKREYGGQSKLF